MRLDIRYQMRFTYDTPVREAHNEVRVRPRDLPTQRLLGHRLTAVPATRILSFTDYWGTTVEHFGHVVEHRTLELVAESAVETRPPDELPPVTLASLDDTFQLAHGECLRPSAHVEWDASMAAAARDATGEAETVQDAVQAIVALTRERLTYETSSTSIGVSLADLLEGGRGVCQDFAHLTIGYLRATGLPARYVSGYLFAVDERRLELDDDLEVVEVLTHAWVEVGTPHGWIAVDPTNDQPVGERHVVVGYGRDYDDVAPVRGVYVGDATPQVEATVEIRRMEPVQRMMTERPRRRAVQSNFVAVAPEVAVAEQQQQQ